jgi:methylenetetrahydrofolate--tRNA-(uracil-5-)-methyltransferase
MASVASAETRSTQPVVVVGAGLAGSECAWVLANEYDLPVVLCEMKPKTCTPAQHMPGAFAELVCSNSLKSTSLSNPSGLLKLEMRALGSLVMPAAEAARVPAGEALAVDRQIFSGRITAALKEHPRITLDSGVVCDTLALRKKHNAEHVVVATGPLTHGGLAEHILERSGESGAKMLAFYDAIAPILDGSSVDLSVAFFGDRETRARKNLSRNKEEGEGALGKTPGDHAPEGDYLNLPLTRDEYLAFVERLLAGDMVPHHDFEEPRYFNACQPIEALAASGPLTLAHGPMKGRGLTDPRTGRWPYAAVQLRREHCGHESYNMVGFQTRLTWPAQRAIFSTLPGLQNAVFHRMGSMHRNTYFCSPRLLGADFALRNDPGLHLCGQIAGVEGYLESAAMGVTMGHILGQRLSGREFVLPPPSTALGALLRHVRDGDPEHYSPMNLHWGLFDAVESHTPIRDKGARRLAMSERAQGDFAAWFAHHLKP